MLRSHLGKERFDGGTNITAIKAADGSELAHVITGTMMRIDLDSPLEPGDTFEFSIDWNHLIVPSDEFGARSGYEIFDDGRSVYQIAQWFPRMAAYTDYDGWQTRPFLGRGEFTLEFGDYELELTVPANHIVASTGTLTNPEDVLTSQERTRLLEATSSDRPVMIVNREEAQARCQDPTTETRTWKFKAENVRDLAWASSPDFAWDALGVDIPGTDERSMAMSYWPREGDGLWDTYSTHAVAHGLEQYSSMSFHIPGPSRSRSTGPSAAAWSIR